VSAKGIRDELVRRVVDELRARYDLDEEGQPTLPFEIVSDTPIPD